MQCTLQVMEFRIGPRVNLNHSLYIRTQISSPLNHVKQLVFIVCHGSHLMPTAMLPFCGNQCTGKLERIGTGFNFVSLQSKTLKLSCTPGSRELGHVSGNVFRETLGSSILRTAFSVWNTSFATIYFQPLDRAQIHMPLKMNGLPSH